MIVKSPGAGSNMLGFEKGLEFTAKMIQSNSNANCELTDP